MSNSENHGLKGCLQSVWSVPARRAVIFLPSGVVGKNVGKKVANTKKMVKWGLLMDNKKYVIMVKHSIVSGKKTIFVNNEIIHEAQQVSPLLASLISVVPDQQLRLHLEGWRAHPPGRHQQG